MGDCTSWFCEFRSEVLVLSKMEDVGGVGENSFKTQWGDFALCKGVGWRSLEVLGGHRVLYQTWPLINGKLSMP